MEIVDRDNGNLWAVSRLNPKQQKSWDKLKKAFQECYDNNIYIAQVLNTLTGYDMSLVEDYLTDDYAYSMRRYQSEEHKNKLCVNLGGDYLADETRTKGTVEECLQAIKEKFNISLDVFAGHGSENNVKYATILFYIDSRLKENIDRIAQYIRDEWDFIGIRDSFEKIDKSTPNNYDEMKSLLFYILINPYRSV